MADAYRQGQEKKIVGLDSETKMVLFAGFRSESAGKVLALVVGTLILLSAVGCGRIRPKFKYKPKIKPRVVRKVPARKPRANSRTINRYQARQQVRGGRRQPSTSSQRDKGNWYLDTVADEAAKKGVEKVVESAFGSSENRNERRRN